MKRMRKSIKKIIPKRVIFQLRVVKKIGVGVVILNRLFKFFRRYKTYEFSLHYTSSIVEPKGISYNKDLATLSSFAVSGGCYFQANNGIVLGENCLFAPGVKMISSNHGMNEGGWIKAESIIIGDNVWIGANVIILPGVKIPDNCIIGAGSVVTKSFADSNLVIVGNPAKKVKVHNESEK